MAEALRQLIGLFIDDEMLAAGILGVTGVVGALSLGAFVPAGLAGVLLAVSLPAILAASVWRSVARARALPPGGAR